MSVNNKATGRNQYSYENNHTGDTMPEELYDKEEIETAFFNYGSDGSEPQNGEWEKRREEWAKFWSHLENYKATAPERCGGC